MSALYCIIRHDIPIIREEGFQQSCWKSEMLSYRKLDHSRGLVKSDMTMERDKQQRSVLETMEKAVSLLEWK